MVSISWDIYTPVHALYHIGGECLGLVTNNQLEYETIIVLLNNVIHISIQHLHVHLHSQLIILQLNNFFCVPNILLLCMFL